MVIVASKTNLDSVIRILNFFPLCCKSFQCQLVRYYVFVEVELSTLR